MRVFIGMAGNVSYTIKASGGRHRLTAGHEAGQRLAFLWRREEPELGAPPQHIVAGLRPFVVHQVAHLGPGEVAGETGPEILEALRLPENARRAGAVGVRQPARMRSGEERIAVAQSGDERIEAVEGKIAARQRAPRGPRRLALEEV